MRFNAGTSILALCLALLGLLLLAVPFATSGPGTWWGIDWIDGRKLFAIDDAYRYFAAKHALDLESVFLWNYVLPLALSFDAMVAAATNGDLLAMRVAHAGIGAATLVVMARASLRAGCGAYLATASVIVVGLMPIYLVLSSSFYAEGLAALLVALAFLFLITERPTALAVTISLLPLVRPEGAIYCLLFIAWFALQRDFARSAIIALPGLAYLAALAVLAPDGASPVDWRIELRSVLSPLDAGISQALSPARLPNLLWAALALVAIFIARWRRWWPMLAAPWLIVAVQLVAIGQGLQGFELRYLFTTFPVFGIAWAFPVRSLLDRYRTMTGRRTLVASSTALATLFFVGTHLLQSDWINGAIDRDSSATQQARRDSGRTLAFDSRPLRAFASRTDALITDNEQIATVFVANWAPLYFFGFPAARPDIDVVLVPHNATLARYSGGHFFGFGLRNLDHHYYRFTPGRAADAPAVLVVRDSGPDPFYFPETDDSSAGMRRVTERAIANVQSGRLKAYAVDYAVRESVTWQFPGNGNE